MQSCACCSLLVVGAKTTTSAARRFLFVTVLELVCIVACHEDCAVYNICGALSCLSYLDFWVGHEAMLHHNAIYRLERSHGETLPLIGFVCLANSLCPATSPPPIPLPVSTLPAGYGSPATNSEWSLYHTCPPDAVVCVADDTPGGTGNARRVGLHEPNEHSGSRDGHQVNHHAPHMSEADEPSPSEQYGRAARDECNPEAFNPTGELSCCCLPA